MNYADHDQISAGSHLDDNGNCSDDYPVLTEACGYKMHGECPDVDGNCCECSCHCA